MTNSQSFKGIALFTPGGDLIYCLDSNKQASWHIQLCIGLQEILVLSEPPYFLIPGYTATVDRWFEPHTHQIKTSAEVYPAVKRYQSLLNVLFATDDLIWDVAPWIEELCNPIILETYRDQFPQLWQDHDLIVRYDPTQTLSELNLGRTGSTFTSVADDKLGILASSELPTTSGYVLRLFVSGNSAATEQILKTIYQVLEQGLESPYTLKVIDISQHPEQAEINQVSAAPTLVRIWPEPVRRIVGDLEDVQRVLQIIANC
ncbi:MAG: circadian clock protein KaiB [Moorea sp. SIO2B7]|nr:circadian clock protein KaiB [Moorena sp. SIO2B7]